jgi:ribosomal protein S18 acetylase RimI-like enzyme
MLVSVSSAIVRPGERRDLGSCVELALAASAEPATRAGRWQEALAADLDDAGRLLLVAELDGEVVGYARASAFAPARDAPPDTAPAGYYLVGLYVRGDCRRRGIGLELTEARLRWIAERAEEAWFFSNAKNEASIALHALVGFEEVTREFSFPGVTFHGGQGVLLRSRFGEPRER